MTQSSQSPDLYRALTPDGPDSNEKPLLEFAAGSEEMDELEMATQESPAEEEVGGTGSAALAPDETARGGDAFRLYLREIGPIKLLTAHEEIELARRVQRGNEQAREQMITSNLKLVVKIAHEFEGAGLSLLDLIAEGNMGLMKAVERFDPDRGTRLASYAAFWIKQHMRRAISNQSRTIRLPVHIHERLWQISRATTRLRELLGRTPTNEEIAGEIKVPASKVGRLREASQSSVSLDASLGEDGSDELGTIIADDNAARPDEHLDEEQSRSALETCLQSLHPREKAVLQERFGLDGHDDHTLEQVGDKFGLTRERIRQIQNRALGKLRMKMLARLVRSVAA
jgi:RNA polymerase primary sigma factor